MANALIPAAGVALGYFVGHTLASAAQLAENDKNTENLRRLLQNPPFKREFNNQLTGYITSLSIAAGSGAGIGTALKTSDQKTAWVFATTALLSYGVSQWITFRPEKSSTKQAILYLSEEKPLLLGSVGGIFGLFVACSFNR